MAGRRWGRGAIALLVAALTVLGLPGCAPETAPRTVSGTIGGPPHLTDWIEIDGLWEVSYEDGEGHALLQPAVEHGWLTDGEEDVPREGGEARWVDVATGEVQWSRSDLGDPIAVEDGVVVAMVGLTEDRTVQAIDTATGETSWSVPETDLGECSGWYRIADREVAVDGGTRTFPILAAPATCESSRRTLLSQLDSTTGQTEALLMGSGRLATELVGDTIVAMTWSSSRVVVELLDLEGGNVTGTIDLRPSQLLSGSTFDGRTALPEHSFVELVEAAGQGIWVSVRWNDPDDEEPYAAAINEFLIDTETAAVERRWNQDCTHPDGITPFYYQWIPSVPMCGAIGFEESEAHITAGSGEETSTWRLPIVGDRPNWVRVVCPAQEQTEDRQMLLVPAADALVRAYDLRTGEPLWSYGEDRAGGRLMVATHREANRLVMLTDTADGAQYVVVLNLCTGAPVSEVPVEGAYLDGRYVPALGNVVTVPLATTTLLAHFVERGASPDDAEDEQV